MLLTRGLPVLLELGLTIFCLIDCIQSPEISIRNLSKWLWIVLILLFPLVGSIAWLVAGRPSPAHRRDDYMTGYPEYQRDRMAPLGPDDDPAYLRELGNTPGHVNHWSKRAFVRELARHGEVVQARSPFPWTMLLVRLR